MPGIGVADEVLQDVYLRIWQRARDYDATLASPITWMAAIARNRAIDEVRRGKTLPVSQMPDGFDLPSDAEDAFDALERSDRLKALMACLNALDKDRRDLILLAYYRGLSREALAQRFERPVAPVKTWLHRSLAQLKVCLSQ